MLAPVKPLLAAADLAICHLETPLSADDTNISGYPVFNTPHELADAIKEAGYKGCSTASNHAIDAGADGVTATLDALDEAGIAHAGTARTREEAEANGWGIIPLEALVDDSAPPEDPNQEYVASLSPSAGVQYEEAMRGPLDQDVEATTENLDAFGCWGRALKVQTETSPWFIGGFESLQAEMERRDEEIPLDPRYVAALADWGACMADAGHPGLESPDDARLSIEDALTTEFPSGFSEDDPRIIELAAQERELAVASFDCEESADLLTVYNQAETDWETAFVANHEAELAALVEAVKAARG